MTVLRSSPHVVCYWGEGRLVLHQFAVGTRAAGSPLAVEILDFFRDGRSPEELRARMPHIPPRLLRAAVGRLVRYSFLQRSHRGRARGATLGSWGDWNPAAGFFHFATKDQPWAAGSELDRMEADLSEKGGTVRPPAPTKRHPGARLVRLPRVRAEGAFPRVLLDRRTWRGFGQGSLPLEQLALLLDLTWGVRFWGKAGANDRVAFKTSPSGGARHPIEAYVAALRVQGLKPGLYHYRADDKHLELVRPGTSSRQVETYLAKQWWFKPAAAVVFMTAVLPRARWRYPFARAYRALLLEAGHVCQTFCLVATWLKLAPFCTMALADSRIERDLGIDGVDEVVLYAAGVGTRPKGGDWVQWPKHAPGHPYLPPSSRGRRRT